MEVVLKNKEAFRTILETYKPSPESIAFLKDMKLVILLGVSASGRNTIINELTRRGEYKFIVSDTTRPPKLRNGVMEQDGVQYHFRSEEEVLREIKVGKFLEAELIHDQQVSGISIRELRLAHESGKIPIDEVDILGTVNIHAIKPDTSFIFVVPPSFDEWVKRWSAREELPEEERHNRMITAEKILKLALSSDFFSFVINNDVDSAATSIDRIVHGHDSQTDETAAKTIAQDLLDAVQDYLVTHKSVKG